MKPAAAAAADRYRGIDTFLLLARLAVLMSRRNWAFNWQNRYQYEKPLELPKGTKIEAEITYDNSTNNPTDAATIRPCPR